MAGGSGAAPLREWESASHGRGAIPAGLCADCLHARRIESERGSVFVMCQLSATDANFAKYPRLPVLSCAGYLRKGEAQGSEDR